MISGRGLETAVAEVQKENEGRRRRVSPGCGCLGSVLLGLLGGLLVVGVLAFAVRSEIRFERGQVGETRFWRVTESDSTVLALSNTRQIRGSEGEGEICQRTTVHFWILGGGTGSEVQSYCDCYRLQDGQWSFVSECE